MNVLERIECDSSAESDVSEAEYDFNKASDDAIDSEDCRSSHESDIVASSIDSEDWVKATYNFKGDGPLSFTAYEEVRTVAEAVRVAHTPNTEAVIRSMSSQSSVQQRHRSYARNCMQPALDYFKGLLDSSLKENISIFKAVRIFNPQKVAKN